MQEILPFLSRCDTLTSGQSLPEIIHKAIVLIEDPVYWCDDYVACIRTEEQTASGIPYVIDTPCRINDPRATCVNLEGAVARACNNWGILPPFLIRALDQWTLDYLKSKGRPMGDEPSIWNPYSASWFSGYYGHEESLNLLHYIYGVVS